MNADEKKALALANLLKGKAQLFELLFSKKYKKSRNPFLKWEVEESIDVMKTVCQWSKVDESAVKFYCVYVSLINTFELKVKQLRKVLPYGEVSVKSIKLIKNGLEKSPVLTRRVDGCIERANIEMASNKEFQKFLFPFLKKPGPPGFGKHEARPWN